MISPIKIKICDRDKFMRTSYGMQQVKVKQVDGTIVVKDKNKVLPTDDILAYLPNDYISPIKIKILDINIHYLVTERIALIVNYGVNAPGGMIVRNLVEANKVRSKLKLFKWRIDRPITTYYARIVSRPPTIKIKDISGMTLKEISEYLIDKICWEHGGMLATRAVIETALDIFKVEGLFVKSKVKQVVQATTQTWSTFKTRTKVNINIPNAIRTVYTDIKSRLKIKTKIDKTVTTYYGYTGGRHKLLKDIIGLRIGELDNDTRLKEFIGDSENGYKKISDIQNRDFNNLIDHISLRNLIWSGEFTQFAAKVELTLSELVHENEAPSRTKQKTTCLRCFNVYSASNRKDKNTLLLSVPGITDSVVRTRLRIKDISDLTFKEIKDNNMTLDNILFKYP